MAGPGIRAAELARVLAAEHVVTLATPRPADALPAGVRGYTYSWGDAASLADALDAADLIVANGYVLEGHVPAADVKRLLKERPAVVGVAVPGMPIGSPGMEVGNTVQAYNVMTFDKQGQSTVFASHGR